MMPGRIFVRERSPLEGMYMVGRGRVLLQTEAEEEENEVRYAGGFFGEDALLNSGKLAKWTAMAGDWSELLLLRGDDFRALGQAEPELKQKVHAAAHSRRASRTLESMKLAATRKSCGVSACGLARA